MTSAIQQTAEANGGGDAFVTLSNAASATIGVLASAHAVGSSAEASANISEGWLQQTADANGGGNASVAFTNDGMIDLTAKAVASRQ